MRILKKLGTILVLVFFLVGCVSTKQQVASHQDHIRGHGAQRPGAATESKQLPDLDENASLQDYIRYAALNNAGLEAAFNRWRAALEKIPQARSLPDPKFSYGYFIQEVETRVGPQRQKFELSQMFPWFGKLSLRGDVASEAANAARQKYEAAKLKLFYRVKKVYYEYYYLARAIAITKENMKLLSDLESVARMKYKAGAAPYAAVIKAQVELGRLQDRLKTLQDLRNPIVAKLNAALNRASDAPLPWPKPFQEEKMDVSEDQLIAWLQENNPELKALEFMTAKEKIGIDLARKNYYPDIMLGVGMVDTDDAIMPDAEDSGKDPVVAMIGINLPIWYGKYRAAEKAARARHLAALKRKADKENNLLADLQIALFNFRDAHRKIDLYGDTLIPKAKQSLEVTQQGFESGKVDFLNLIDAERLLLEFQLSYERALANHAQRLAELEMLVGKEIPRLEGGAK